MVPAIDAKGAKMRHPIINRFPLDISRWHERMLCGIASLLDAIITLGSLGFFFTSLRLSAAIYMARSDLYRREARKDPADEGSDDE